MVKGYNETAKGKKSSLAYKFLRNKNQKKLMLTTEYNECKEIAYNRPNFIEKWLLLGEAFKLNFQNFPALNRIICDRAKRDKLGTSCLAARLALDTEGKL